MEKLVNAIEFYYSTSILKDLIRQGAIEWKVKKQHLESIAEHTYGCLMLAFGLNSEFKFSLDFNKVIKMLSVHELEEIIIGDITVFQGVSKAQKADAGNNAVKKILSLLTNPKEINELVNEFNACKTEEAKFAKAVDKLECVLEFKKYVDNGLTNWEVYPPEIMKNEYVKYLYDRKEQYDLSDAFYMFHKSAFEYLGFSEEIWRKHIKPILTNAEKLKAKLSVDKND